MTWYVCLFFYIWDNMSLGAHSGRPSLWQQSLADRALSQFRLLLLRLVALGVRFCVCYIVIVNL